MLVSCYQTAMLGINILKSKL